MRVAIDARILSEPLSGIGRYTFEMTKELITKPGDFFIYSSAPIHLGDWSKINVKFRSSNFSNRLSKMLWSQTILPYWAAKDNIDVFWGPAHRIPRYLPDRIARVLTIHDLVWKYAGGTMRPLSRMVEKRLMPEAVRLANKIIVDSESTAKDLRCEFLGIDQRVKVVYPGVTKLPEAKDPNLLFTMGIIRPYFLFVGTLEPRKNLNRLLSAYSKIDNEVKSKFQLVVAGGKGWGGIDLYQIIKSSGLDDHVIVTGYIDDSSLAALYKNALFLAMPSLFEGFGLPILEAMSFGIPVLTSNNSSMAEVARDAAIYVDPLDEFSIFNGLMVMLSDERNRNDLARRAKVNAQRFSWQEAGNALWKAIEEAQKLKNEQLGQI